MNIQRLTRWALQAGSLGSTYKSLREAAANAQRARLPQMAAALSYRTIFGLLPVIIVALVGLKMFTSPEDIQTLAKKVLNSTGITAIAIDEDDVAVELAKEQSRRSWMRAMGFEDLPPVASHTAAPSGVADVDDPTTDAARAAARASKRLDDWIQQLITRVNAISFPALGLIGITALIYAALGMLVEIERAFNQIFRATRGRSWSMRIVLYWTLLTLGPLALFATFYVGNRARALTEHLVTSLPGLSGDLSAIGVVILGYIFTVLISGAVLLLLYMAVPNAKVAFRSAAIGAVVAAIAWEASKWGFAQYIDFTRGQSYVRLYGSVALIPLFLLWVYVTWLVVLFGLQIAFHLQYRRQADPVSLLLESVPSASDPAIAIDLLKAMARTFRTGKPSSTRDLAQELSLPDSIPAVLMPALAQSGLIHRVYRRPSRPFAVVSNISNVDPEDNEKDGSTESVLRNKYERRISAGTDNQAEGPSQNGDPQHNGQATPPALYVLARPPETILLREVLQAVFRMRLGSASEPASGTLETTPSGRAPTLADQLRSAQVQAVGESTLADAIGQPALPGGTPKPEPSVPHRS